MPYLDPVFAEYAEGGVFSAKTGYLKLISESGIIGFCLFVGWYLRLMLLITPRVRLDPVHAAAIPIAALMALVYMLTTQVAAEIWTAAGLLATIAGTRTRPASVPRPAPVGLVAA
jgi:hypothetical protein